MNKRLRNISLAALMIISMAACKKDYLETKPTDQIPTTDIFLTVNNAWGAINGIHRSLYIQYLGNQDQGGQSANMIYMDAMGDDLVMYARGSGWFISDYQWLNHRNVNSRVPYFNYYFYYKIIGNANNIIANVDNAVGPEADKKVIKGQALAYRAWSMYQMVQLFGKRYVKGAANDNPGIPLVLEPTQEGLPRSTVAEVYTQIHKDLDDAIGLLTGAAARKNKSHLDVGVAKGIKARVYLTQQEWDNAAKFAAEARTGYGLMSNTQYMGGFNDYTNPEWMWGSRQIEDQSTFFYSFFAYMSANFSSSHIRASPKSINKLVYDKLSATDIRSKLWDPTGKDLSFPIPTPTSARFPYMNRKFLIKGTTSIGDVPLMRAGEMYLIEAEARARNGQDAEAQNALFTLIKNRDPQYVKSTNTGTALIDEIMLHRRAELWGEGFRFYDLKRLNLPLDRRNTNHPEALALRMEVPVGDIEWEWLIPQAELNANPNMTQNPL